MIEGKPEHHPGASYSLRYRTGLKRIYEPVGRDPQAVLTAKLRREHLLRGEAMGMILPEAADKAGPPSTEADPFSLDAAMEAYLLEAELRTAKRTVLAYRRCLVTFRASCSKSSLGEIDRSDVLAYIRFRKEKGLGARTVSNRVCALRTFLRANGLPDVVKIKDVPRYTEKVVASYSPSELKILFEACTPEELIRFRFFLGSGGREQEVMYACWADVDWDAGLFNITAKRDLGWTLKDHEERSVPLPDSLLGELTRRRESRPDDRFLFPTDAGKPDGHLLRQLKRVALAAGLNCGHCRNKNGLRCDQHPVCRRFDLHKFRKTFAGMHHESGVSMRTLQDWLGHADLATTQQYLAAADKRSQRTKAQVNRTFAALEVCHNRAGAHHG